MTEEAPPPKKIEAINYRARRVEHVRVVTVSVHGAEGVGLDAVGKDEPLSSARTASGGERTDSGSLYTPGA